MPRSLTAGDFRPYVLRRGLGGQSGTQWFFTEAGRPFTFYAVLGSHTRRARLVPKVNDLIGALAIRPADPAAVRAAVHRPRGRCPVELIGLYLVACVLLVAAGTAKALRPADTARALATLTRLPMAVVRPVVRVGSVVEASLGCVAFVFPGPVPAGLVALSYRGLRGVRGLGPAPGGAIASCGCFGTPDTPATMLHVIVNVGLAVAAAVAVALAGSTGPSSPSWPASPDRGLPLLAVSALCLAGLPGHLGDGRAPGRPTAHRSNSGSTVGGGHPDS